MPAHILRFRTVAVKLATSFVSFVVICLWNLYANAMQPHWENSITNHIMQQCIRLFLDGKAGAHESFGVRALILPHKLACWLFYAPLFIQSI